MFQWGIEFHWPPANDPSGGGQRGNSPGNCSVSYLSFVYGSTGGVCGRSLMAGKFSSLEGKHI